ncbi:MAG: hypothetical protein IKU34_04575 [Clostridia bacterium]|nr:hypothetical protein [Clostridia bacterium]
MKRLILLTLLFALLSVNAAAEIVGTTPQLENIHRYTAPNGQEIYYISREEEWATVQQADVNFDGHDDLVFLITQGASNGFFEFYVWDGSQYVLAGRNDLFDDGLPNYALDPEHGLVTTYHQIGWAGLLHEKHVFRWEGSDLKLVRYAISQNHKTAVFEGDVFVTIENNDLLQVRVFECRYGEDERTDEVIFERIVSMKEGFDEHALLEEEDAALWDGLK